MQKVSVRLMLLMFSPDIIGYRVVLTASRLLRSALFLTFAEHSALIENLVYIVLCLLKRG